MLDRPNISESKESYGMQGWFQKLYRAIRALEAIVTKTAAYTVLKYVQAHG